MPGSILLGTAIPTVPAVGDPEPSFIGGSRVGAGGQPDGNRDLLIGPHHPEIPKATDLGLRE
jgi:hypothetical protein